MSHTLQSPDYRVQDRGCRVPPSWCLRSVAGVAFGVWGFRVSGERFWGLEFGVGGSVGRVHGSGIRVSGIGFRGSDFGYRVSGFGLRIDGVEFRVWGIGFRV